MRPPFRSVAWACSSETLAPPISPCALAVEFVRSCFSGYWRFDANRPGLLTPGYYFFVPDDRPHLSDFHYFGSEDWRAGDDPQVVGEAAPVRLGNDKSLGWEWYGGFPVEMAPPNGIVGNLEDFGRSQSLDGTYEVNLWGGIDLRCYTSARPCYTDNLLLFGTSNCALALVFMQLIRHLGNEDFDDVRTFLTTFLGPGVDVRIFPGAGTIPPFCIAQTPRNNLFILHGTHTWNGLVEQIWQGRGGPTTFGNIGTLPQFWRYSSAVIDAANLAGVDYSKPTYITGHSQGAAVSYVLWHRLYQASPIRILRVMSFATPKPGDHRLETLIRLFCIHTAFVGDGDIVPRIPPDNTARAAVQLVFPLVPNAWFTEWKPLDEYIHLMPGGIWERGPWRSATAAETIEFLRREVFMREGAAGPFHSPRSYVARLALHCPRPEAPFDADCYQQLFGTDFFSNGGELLGGGGRLRGNAAAGLILGGAGALEEDGGGGLELGGAGALAADGGGGLELGGAGAVAADGGGGLEIGGAGALAADGGGGLEIGGLGELEPEAPGASCSEALLISLDTDYTYDAPTAGNFHWFKFPVTASQEYYVKLTLNSGSFNANVTTGTCGSPTFEFIVPGFSSDCNTFTKGSDTDCMIQVQPPLIGTGNYTLRAGEGGCP